MRIPLTIALGGLLAAPVHAAELTIEVEIPSMTVAEYHRPYVAVYVEGADGKAAADLAVWYMLKDTAAGHGTKWLPDLRQWWRKSGRNQAMPVDGVTGPTRPAGRHALSFDARDPRLAGLAPGRYSVVVEAVREIGGRELLKIPFDWPATAARSGQARGRTELGAVALSIKP
ncbi:MAG: DUF2271 domain-containing protein [Gammaproteobacteria bacterium]|nr:DUF2271 domain-containing protein [Gammaproteobacteria bacterium]